MSLVYGLDRSPNGFGAFSMVLDLSQFSAPLHPRSQPEWYKGDLFRIIQSVDTQFSQGGVCNKMKVYTLRDPSTIGGFLGTYHILLCIAMYSGNIKNGALRSCMVWLKWTAEKLTPGGRGKNTPAGTNKHKRALLAIFSNTGGRSHDEYNEWRVIHDE